eukprot:COSAG03_NODE_12937_length_524_cov_0.971765_1_plen_119_part_10
MGIAGLLAALDGDLFWLLAPCRRRGSSRHAKVYCAAGGGRRASRSRAIPRRACCRTNARSPRVRLAAAMDGELAFFRDNGYFVQHAALSTSEVATIVAAMAEEARRHPSEWQISKERRN